MEPIVLLDKMFNTFKSIPEQVDSPRRLSRKIPQSEPEISDLPPMLFQSNVDLKEKITKPLLNGRNSPSLQRNKNFLKPITDSPRMVNIEYKEIYENKHLIEAFREFLKLAHTEEQFEFILECKTKLKIIDSSETSKEMAKLAIDLYHLYIDESSEKVLNLSSEERVESGIEKKIQKLKENNPPVWNLDITPTQMFTPIVNSLKISIQQAHFNDFKKTKLCRDALKLMDKEFIEIQEIKDLDVLVVIEKRFFI